MNERVDITASIVLYNENVDEVLKVINSILNTKVSKKLFLVDNSPTDSLKKWFNHTEIKYLFVGKNIGFGAGHNLVINEIINKSDHHLILNPDIQFENNVIPKLIKEIEKHDDVAMIAPKAVFPNGEHQHSCRRYPTAYELLARIFKLSKRVIAKGEYQEKDLSKAFYPDFLQGCFHLYNTKDFVQMKGFDERYFLYMEDVDICRKIDQIGKRKLYYPYVQITHILKKESSKNLRLFFTHLNSSIKYFKKWGF